jgi:hyperosmotically inducible periplasmic protein
MRLATTAIALAVAAALTAACDRPKTQGTAYNNSGNSAAPATASSTTPSSTTTTTSDNASTNTAANPTVAPGPAGDATGAVSETMTTGKVKAAIAADAGLRDTDISVTTNNGVVMLSGTVKSQDQVAIATNLAQKMDGVQKVESSLVVK